MNELTVLERKFISAYIENGGNGRKAYLAAGYKNNNKQSYIDQLISRLVKKPQVVLELQKRLSELDKSAAISFESKRLELWDMAQTWRDTGDVRAGVAAVNEMNKMDGHHAAQNMLIRSEQFIFGQMMDVDANPADSDCPIAGELADAEIVEKTG